MGGTKRYIQEHQENCPERLQPEFVAANIADFLDWAGNQDKTDIWDLITEYCEQINPDSYFEFCADDLNGE